MNANKTVKRGPRMEYLVAAIFQGEGFLVRRALPLRLSIEGQDITDIDVIGFKFTRPFHIHLVICDCKDKRSPKPFERIFWAKGVADFLGADEVYVALPRVSTSTINFGRSGRVRILSNSVLEDQYKRTYSADKTAYGMANDAVAEVTLKRINSVCNSEKGFQMFRGDVEVLYLSTNPYVGMNQTHTLLTDAGTRLMGTDEGSDLEFAWRYIVAELIVLSCFFILRIAADTLGLSQVERKKHITERLTYGSIAPDKAKEIFKLAKELAAESVRSIIVPESRQGKLPFESLDIETPNYAPAVVGLVERAIANPALYHDLPQLIDFLLFEQALQDRLFSDVNYRHVFPATDAEERLKAARNILAFVRDSAGIKFARFWPKHEQPRAAASATSAGKAAAKKG